MDATQGVQAQTISNLYLAIEHDLEIIPVLNKIDMEAAMVDVVRDQVVDLLGCDPDDVLLASARTGEGVEAVLNAIVERIPAPKGDPEAPLQALIFDSVFNSFRGIIAYFKVENGSIRTGDRVKFVNTGKEYTADEVGVLKMKLCPTGEIPCGSVGYIISGIKTAVEVKVGDTITHVANPCKEAIAGFEDVKPMSPKAPSRWASVSAAASWACSIWRSCRNACSASSIWTSSPRCRTYLIRYIPRRARWSTCTTLRVCPLPP